MGGFNGNGVYVRYYNWQQDAAANIDITASRVDTEDSGFATGLSTVICKDGQTTLTANIPFAGFRPTGVGNGVALNDLPTIMQTQNSVFMILSSVSGGATNTLIGNTSPVITAYVTGQVFTAIPDANNTGDTTINIAALGAIHILKNGATLGANDLQANIPFQFIVVTGSPTQAHMLSPATTPFIPSYSLQPNTINSTQTSLASATTTDLGTIPSQNILINGTATIAGFGSSANVKSPLYVVEFSGASVLTYNATSMILNTGGINYTTSTGDRILAEYLGSGNWRGTILPASGKSVSPAPAPTVQYLTASGTYPTPTNCREIFVQMIGPGGGGGAVTTNSGTAGGTTTFNSISANGGGGGGIEAAGGGIPGAGGTGGTGTAAYRRAGRSGYPGGNLAIPTGAGGDSVLGFGASNLAGTAIGASAAANSGGGGAGGNNNGSCGSGGGGGEYAEFFITSPASTYTYIIGAGGAGGTAGTQAGGAGGTGFIKVTEYY